MILRAFKRLLKMDYPVEIQPVIERLSFIFNDAIGQLYEAVNGKLSLDNNILSSVKDVTFQVNADGLPTSRTTFNLDGSKVLSVKQCFVGQIINQTVSTIYPASGVSLSWTQEAGEVVINHVTGLRPGYSWTLRITAFG